MKIERYKVYEIDTGILNIKGERGKTTVKMVLFQDMKDMADEYQKLPPIVAGLQEKRFGRVLAGLILAIRRRYDLGCF